MLIVYVVLLALLFLSLIPAATAILARRMGRSFGLWFFIGMLLPVIAVLILCFLPEQHNEHQVK